MNCVHVVIFLLIGLFSIPNIAYASVPEEGPDLLEIRAGEHSGFMRIVLEGRLSTISEGKVNQQGNDIIVTFTGRDFAIKKTVIPVAYKADKDSVTFTLKQAGKLKAYSLKDPGRFVIDVYPEEERVKKQAKALPKPEIEKSERNRGSVMPAVSGKDNIRSKEEVAKTKLAKEYDEKSLIPENYKALWSLLETGNFYAVLKELPLHKPENTGALAVSHYIYAKAYIMAKQYFDAVKHLRLAYIYAPDNALKELALLKRAGIYLELKLNYEARADCLVFIRDFPSSGYIEKAHAALAESLYRIGLYQEAIEHYRKSGESPETLYGMANALQKLEMVEEAKKAYAQAMLTYKTYIKSSDESAYLVAENMRMTGDLAGAKKHLSEIEVGPFRNNAIISAGLIAVEESNMQEAIRHFKTSLESRDQKVRVQALFNLSLVYLKEGKFKEATSSLEEIRHDHIDSNMYKEALLALAKIYKKEGRIKDSVSLLKELVYGKQPPAEAFYELEEIVMSAGGSSSRDGLSFVKLWNDVGQWLVDESREDFLLKVAVRLRHEGKPFIDLCSWLVENASAHARGRAAIDLADYYIGIGNTALSREHLNIAKDAGETGDAALRVEAKINYYTGDQTAALKQIVMIKDTDKGDLALLGNIISKINDPGMKDVQKAMAFYERKLNEGDWETESYIAFADILYMNDDINRALKYYRIAGEKSPENEWVMYRLARETERQESKDILSRLQKEDNLFGRLAKSKLMEMSLMNKVREVY